MGYDMIFPSDVNEAQRGILRVSGLNIHITPITLPSIHCALETCLDLPFLVLTFPGKYQNCFYSVILLILNILVLRDCSYDLNSLGE